jgi:hypothetical protein
LVLKTDAELLPVPSDSKTIFFDMKRHRLQMPEKRHACAKLHFAQDTIRGSAAD